jgi:predicted CoA-binding protein
MQILVRDFLKQKHFAVVGSFQHEQKYAYQILKSLKDDGHEVYPVSSRFKKVEGLTCYPSVKDIPVVCDVANIVTPPVVTMKIVKECREKGINRIWLQPGAETHSVIEFCKQNNLEVVYNLCVMLGKL